MLATCDDTGPKRFELLRGAVDDSLHLERHPIPVVEEADALCVLVKGGKKTVLSQIIQIRRLPVLHPYARLSHERNLRCSSVSLCERTVYTLWFRSLLHKIWAAQSCRQDAGAPRDAPRSLTSL